MQQQREDEDLAAQLRRALSAHAFGIRGHQQVVQDFVDAVRTENADDYFHYRRQRLRQVPHLDEVLSRFQEQGSGRFEIKPGNGVRLNVYFRNTLALYNARLLRYYGLCDARVPQMVIFVRAWARRRGICSTSSNTLNRYSFLLMVLHYSINVCQPPVIPNLQCGDHHIVASALAQCEPEEVEGHDATFWRNEPAIADAREQGHLTSNKESVATLWLGFFQYFSSERIPGRPPPLHWINDAISLRHLGGTCPKKDLGWVSAETKRVKPAHRPNCPRRRCQELFPRGDSRPAGRRSQHRP